MVCLLANVKLGGFRSQLQASYMSSHTEELWYNETVCGWQNYIYIYIYIYIDREREKKCVYLGSKLLFKQVLLKTMEHCLLFLILLFFYCRDLDGKGIVLYLLPKRFWPYFWSSSGVV